MIDKMLGKEEIGAALVLALSGTIAAMAANGSGSVSLGRMVSGALSNPIPRRQPAEARSPVAPRPSTYPKAE